MLRKTILSLPRTGTFLRTLGSDRKGPKDPTPKEVLGEEILDAVNNVVDDLHKNNNEAKKIAKGTLLNKLMSHEKGTYKVAAAAQETEMLDDPSLRNLLDFVTSTKKQQTPRPILARKEKQGIVMLRKEIFYQAKQEGYSATEAQRVAENAVEKAKERIEKQRQAQLENKNIGEEQEQMKTKRSEKEQRLFELAYETAEKMLYQDELTKAAPKSLVKPNPGVGSLLNTTKRLNIFETVEGKKETALGFWDDWDLRAARIMNQSMGPENAFEEQIVWTEKGKQWPYPINNEYLLGEEENVSFIDHIFFERHLPSLGIPKNGPIAHFMHLVCVGLSKNPYMTAAKKMEHLRWFANYFNAEKQQVVHKLHEEEQLAIAQTVS